MLQAEVGGARVTAAGELPKVGQRLRDFSLPSVNGKQVQLSDFRGHRSLALVFAGLPGMENQYLAELARNTHAFEEEEGRVLVIVASTYPEPYRTLQGMSLPSEVLTDEDGTVHRLVGAGPAPPGSGAAAYVTDRFGEIFAIWRTAAGQTLPQPQEIVEWFRYIGQLCPECEPPEWPKE